MYFWKGANKADLIVEKGTKSLRSQKEGAVHDEEEKITDERLMLKAFVDNISCWIEHLLCPKYSTCLRINNGPQNNKLAILDKNWDVIFV